MSTLPNPIDQSDHSLFDGNPVVDEVEKALCAFGGVDLPQEDALRLLGLWAKNYALTARERAAVVARFTAAPVDRSDQRPVRDEPSYLAGYHDGLVAASVHAFTPQRIVYPERPQVREVFGDDFMWTCKCGYTAVQVAGDVNITVRLAEHTNGGKALREIGEYRKRLDAWSTRQEQLLDELHPERGTQ